MWSVVIFTEDNTVSAVPSSWVDEENQLCYWPSKKNNEKLIRDNVLPDKKWKLLNVKIFMSGIKMYSNTAQYVESAEVLTSNNESGGSTDDDTLSVSALENVTMTECSTKTKFENEVLRYLSRIDIRVQQNSNDLRLLLENKSRASNSNSPSNSINVSEYLLLNSHESLLNFDEKQN